MGIADKECEIDADGGGDDDGGGGGERKKKTASCVLTRA
jgi:hypothetical protein